MKKLRTNLGNFFPEFVDLLLIYQIMDYPDEYYYSEEFKARMITSVKNLDLVLYDRNTQEPVSPMFLDPVVDIYFKTIDFIEWAFFEGVPLREDAKDHYIAVLNDAQPNEERDEKIKKVQAIKEMEADADAALDKLDTLLVGRKYLITKSRIIRLVEMIATSPKGLEMLRKKVNGLSAQINHPNISPPRFS